MVRFLTTCRFLSAEETHLCHCSFSFFPNTVQGSLVSTGSGTENKETPNNPSSSVAKPFPSNCGSLDLLFANFSMILRILSQYFLNRKRERKTTRRKRNDETYARKRFRHNPAFSLHKKSWSYRYWNRRSSRQNCFTITCETER